MQKYSPGAKMLIISMWSLYGNGALVKALGRVTASVLNIVGKTYMSLKGTILRNGQYCPNYLGLEFFSQKRHQHRP